jgi:hypothetical protein
MEINQFAMRVSALQADFEFLDSKRIYSSDFALPILIAMKGTSHMP